MENLKEGDRVILKTGQHGEVKRVRGGFEVYGIRMKISNPKNISEFMQIADAEIQEDGTFIVHCEGKGFPGKLYGIEAGSEYEALEEGWNYISALGSEVEEAK